MITTKCKQMNWQDNEIKDLLQDFFFERVPLLLGGSIG